MNTMTMNAEPVTVVISCLIKREMIETGKRALADVIGKVLLAESACHGIRVHEDPDRPGKLLIVEYWNDKEYFLGPHMQTSHMVAFFKVAESFLEGKTHFDFWTEVLLSP